MLPQPSPVALTETNELPVSPTSGVGFSFSTTDSSPRSSSPLTQTMQPVSHYGSQLLQILSDIDASPSRLAIPNTAAQQSVSPSFLTERALRYARREALRTDLYPVAPAPLPSLLTDPLDHFGAITYDQYRLSTDTCPREYLSPSIPNLDQYRSPFRTPAPLNIPASFPRMSTPALASEHRSFSAGACRLPTALPLSPLGPSRASDSAMSSASSSSSKLESKTANGGRQLSDLGTATSRPAARSGRVPETSSPVASSALRTVAGPDNGRFRGLRPDAPVSPRAALDGPSGLPAHLGCLRRTWNRMDPSMRDEIGAITVEDLRTSLASADASPDTPPACTTADDHALALAELAEQEHASRMRPMQAKATLLGSSRARLAGQERLNAAAMLTATREHEAYLRNIRGDSGRNIRGDSGPPPAPTTAHQAAPAAPAAAPVPAAPQWRHVVASAPSTTGNANTMAPPAARARSDANALWSVVTPHPRRQPRDGHDGLPANRYEDLRVSRLKHINKYFPTSVRRDIKEVASYVDCAFRELGNPRCYVAHAIRLATKANPDLRGPLIPNILRLRDLLDRAYASPSGVEWIRDVSRQTASSGSDTFSSAGPRRREEPSSGRGNSKKASLTSDSEDHQPESRGRYFQDHRKG